MTPAQIARAVWVERAGSVRPRRTDPLAGTSSTGSGYPVERSSAGSFHGAKTSGRGTPDSSGTQRRM